MGAVPVEIRQAAAHDHDELYTAFSRIVGAGEGFPQQPPLTREDFDDYWIRPAAAVSVACFGGYLVGASYIKPNYVGRAAHIANAGYFVVAAYRGTGVGRSLVEHSLREARRLGFDAMMFNLVFESNPARAMYRQLGFDEVGRVPSAVEGEDAVIYWRSLEDIVLQDREVEDADLEGRGRVSGTDVTVEQVGAHVGVVRLNRPPNNYFDTALIVGVAEAYEELDRSGWCRAIVLGSEGRHFCAGLDFAANAGQDIAALYSAALRLFAAPLPVVAAVQGAAIGGGCGLALSADFRVATAQSRFSANFSRLGFHHGFALTVTLPAAVGRQAAADLLLSGRRVRGEQALALGLCDRLAGEDDLLAEAIAYADELAAAGPLAVRSIRATLRSGLVEEARLAMEHEYAEQTRLRDTADFAEGLRAAAEMRDPVFRGE